MKEGRTIVSFSGPYRFLSNFYQHQTMHNGILWPTAEHAYQAAKTDNPSQKAEIATAETPGEAKRRGTHVTLKKDWDEILRIPIMFQILHSKFSDPGLREKLSGTEDANLVEGNAWGDKYWGVYRGEGKNWLGKLLMKVRDEIQNKGGPEDGSLIDFGEGRRGAAEREP